MKQLGALSLTRTLKKDAKLERVQVGNDIELDEEDIHDGEITQLGRLMTALPIDLKSSRMIYIGAFLGLAEEAIVMAACSENGGIWLENNHRDKYQMEEDALGAIDGLQNITYWARGTESDQIAALHAFLAWLQRMPKRYQEWESGVRIGELGQIVREFPIRKMKTFVKSIGVGLLVERKIKTSTTWNRSESGVRKWA